MQGCFNDWYTDFSVFLGMTDRNVELLAQDYFELLSSQVFIEEMLDYTILQRHIDLLKRLDVLKTSSMSIFDLFKKEHVYLSKTFELVLGYNIEEAHKAGNSYFDSKVHPDDFVSLLKAGNYFIKMAFELSSEKRKDYKVVMDYRIKNGKGDYVRVIEQFQGLELDHQGNIWLALCVMDISPDQDLETPLRNRIINIKNGEIFHFPDINQDIRTSHLSLTEREKEILKLVAQGLISKQIADKLYISVHTVNTHRQRIIEKLDVANTFEAIQYASKLGIIA